MANTEAGSAVASTAPRRMYDVFITHAWRYHDDWTQVCALLDHAPGFKWRNFSLPWHDPAMDTNSEVGRKFIYDALETQIIPVNAVILLAGVYAVKSAQRWLDLEIEFARKHKKPIIGLPAIGSTEVPLPVGSSCDKVAVWDSASLVRALQEACGWPEPEAAATADAWTKIER